MLGLFSSARISSIFVFAESEIVIISIFTF